MFTSHVDCHLCVLENGIWPKALAQKCTLQHMQQCTVFIRTSNRRLCMYWGLWGREVYHWKWACKPRFHWFQYVQVSLYKLHILKRHHEQTSNNTFFLLFSLRIITTRKKVFIDFTRKHAKIYNADVDINNNRVHDRKWVTQEGGNYKVEKIKKLKYVLTWYWKMRTKRLIKIELKIGLRSEKTCFSYVYTMCAG